ncbi:glycosyltransferase family 8 protein [Pseudorhodobacter aquimaris]|uniref:glycosyltransferase family 8 protein n=1 Tax=Pseudorhodobacter aquimaris TaxID=687412 RepID=UPI00067D23CF|nr:glycosyltransferase family 8 protein [Pseudorhodobacter aquimaris]
MTNAIALCCDRNYLPISCFLADQIANQNPHAPFDICICSSEKMQIPTDLAAKGVKFLHLDTGPALAKQKSVHLPVSTYLRLWLPDLLGDTYAKILYLDSDMMLEGGDLADLFAVDMHGRAVAAVRDMQQWLRPEKHIRDFRHAGLPPAPYFNGGVELFDVEKFRGDQILETCLHLAKAHPDAVVHHDQSLLNIALHRNWTELSPVWNWQWAGKRPLFGLTVPLHISHFAGAAKPWVDPDGICPPRYLEMLRPYLDRYFPDCGLLGTIAPPNNAVRGSFLRNTLEHFLIMRRIHAYHERFDGPQHSIPVSAL